jgi:uncharacterized protein YprB with RNaseH-like and TPR domain
MRNVSFEASVSLIFLAFSEIQIVDNGYGYPSISLYLSFNGKIFDIPTMVNGYL